MSTATVLQMNTQETEQQASDRIAKRFRALEVVTRTVASGAARAAVITGPSGVSKSWTIEKTLEELSDAGEIDYVQFKGHMKATGLYKALYENRFEDTVLVLDDIDTVLFDEVSLNILKAACDTTERRHISWGTETKMETEDGEKMPRSFEYEGSIIIVTNLNIQALADKGNKLSPHYDALISRALYLDLKINSVSDYIIRIKQVVYNTTMCNNLNEAQKSEMIEFITLNQDSFRDVSLRLAKKISGLMIGDPVSWKEAVEMTCFK